MTVEELIGKLKDMPSDAPIVWDISCIEDQHEVIKFDKYGICDFNQHKLLPCVKISIYSDLV